MSPNWLLSRISGGYVEGIRNLPLLFQILFWYLAVLAALPNPRQSISLFDSFFLNNRGLVIPKPIGKPGFEPFAVRASGGDRWLDRCCGAMRAGSFSRRGKVIKVWPYALGLLIGLPLVTALIFGAPVTFELPVLKGFNFAGGSRVIPEFVALTLALSTYTAAFIAEIVRAGILSVHKGQMEAGSSLGLQRGSVLRLIVIPQAMRVILPPLTNQYLNLTKNSSLAVGSAIRSGLGVRGHDAEPDRAGDRDHRHHHGRLFPDLADHQRDHEFLRLADRPEHGQMSDIAASAFVRQELVPQRAAPIKTTGFIGFLRTRLFNSPTNILITIVSVLLLWFILVPAIRFLLVDAVWTGSDRNACLAENAGRPVGACWPFIQAKLSQFIYGFYPEPERWRVNLTFLLAAVLLLPLLIPRLPAKGINAFLFFLAFPVVAFFLLYGGGLNGFGVSWTAGLLSGFNDSVGEGGRKLELQAKPRPISGRRRGCSAS